MADIKYIITVDSAGAVKAVKDFESAIDGSGGAAGRAEPKHASLFTTIFSAQAVYGATKRVGREFVDLLKDSVGAATEDMQSQDDLRAAIDQTGRSYALIGPVLEAFASKMERDTLYTDDQTRSAAALLVQMTDLDANGIQRALRGAAGLATVMKTDLNSASMMIMKAMEGNYVALSRYGIKVDENLSSEEKRAAILDQLEGMYGRATAATETLAGRTEQLKKSWENAKEELGKTITSGGIWKATLEILTGATEALQEGLKSKTRKLEEAVLAQKAYNDQNAAAYELLKQVGDQMGWSSIKLHNLSQEFGGSYITLQKWVESNYFGKKAVDALAGAQDGLTATQRSYWETLKALGVPTLKEEAKAAEDRQKKLTDLKAALAEGVISHAAYTAEVEKLNKKHEAAAGSGEKLRDVMAHITAGFIKFRAAANPAQKAYDDFMDSLNVSLPTIDELGSEAFVAWAAGITETNDDVLVLKGSMESLINDQLANMKPPDTKTWQDWGADAQMIISNVFSGVNTLLSGMTSVNQQALDNTLANLDAEYQARKKTIEQSILDEATKATQLAALDAEFEKKKTDAKRSAAQKQKSLDIAQALSGVAQAVISALQVKPFFPLGLAMAAMAAAMGAAQVSAIKAQPIPLAEGAVFSQPTEFMSAGGQRFIAGERGIEIMAGERAIRKVFREEVGGRGGERNSRAQAVANFNLFLDGKKVGGFVLETVQEGIDLKKLKIRSRNIVQN